MSRRILVVIFVMGLFLGVGMLFMIASHNNNVFRIKSTDPTMTVIYDPEFENTPRNVPTTSNLTTQLTITMTSAIDPTSKIGVTTNNQDSFSTSISGNKLVLLITSTSKHLKGGSSYSLGISGVRSAKTKKTSSFILRFNTDGINQVESFNQSLPYIGNGYVIIYSVFANYYSVITERGFNPSSTKTDALSVLQKNGINTIVADIRYESR